MHQYSCIRLRRMQCQGILQSFSILRIFKQQISITKVKWSEAALVMIASMMQKPTLKATIGLVLKLSQVVGQMAQNIPGPVSKLPLLMFSECLKRNIPPLFRFLLKVINSHSNEQVSLRLNH
ncbi:hypothetical protein FGO68_gene13589 [Halteria grandinella]|uniref:Uncharacterized protein n=1 Tax=Halteria grandinella TaxID=5974 RepID=A0A8J8N9R9_HALGN|nr:hypothetical protein FGO68_gene13589 [Halteria grandinella]